MAICLQILKLDDIKLVLPPLFMPVVTNSVSSDITGVRPGLALSTGYYPGRGSLLLGLIDQKEAQGLSLSCDQKWQMGPYK